MVVLSELFVQKYFSGFKLRAALIALYQLRERVVVVGWEGFDMMHIILTHADLVHDVTYTEWLYWY